MGVTDSPDFFSRSGSFSFDSGNSKVCLSQIAPESSHFPTLRLAWRLDPTDEAERDPTLKELMNWATTVVRLPIRQGHAQWLADDIAEFPAQFLLFSPHVGSLILDDRSRGIYFEIKQSVEGSDLILTAPAASERWRVFKTEYHPSAEALTDAGELARREVVPLVWAVRLRGRLDRGSFWAFFPTEYKTTLSGIINAPWKTNEDRQNLLRGTFNNELLRRVAKLVVESIPDLMREEDPGWFLDVLPARGREAPSWADELITEEVYRLAKRYPTLPDQTGRLRLPSEILLNPENLSRDTVDTWAAYPGRPEQWCHPSVNTRERYPRALRLREAAGCGAEDIVFWLEALVADGTYVASIAALNTAARVLKEDSRDLAEGARRASIILTENLTHASAGSQNVFLPSDYKVQDAGIAFVHRDVFRDRDAIIALKELGVGPINLEAEIKARLAQRPMVAWSVDEWDSFWELAGRLDAAIAADLIENAVGDFGPFENGPLLVRTLAGDYRSLQESLLPGPVVPADGSRDAEFTVDTRFNIDLVKRLGAVAAPTTGKGAPNEAWFDQYTNEAIRAFLNSQRGGGSQPRPDYLRVVEGECVRPLTTLSLLSDAGRVKLTQAALEA